MSILAFRVAVMLLAPVLPPADTTPFVAFSLDRKVAMGNSPALYGVFDGHGGEKAAECVGVRWTIGARTFSHAARTR